MRKIFLVLCLVSIMPVLSGMNTAFAGWADITPAVSTKTLYGIWGTSATDVYAAGADGVIVHFNGTDWSVETSNTTSQLVAVWGASATNIYAVGKEDAVEGTVTLLHKTSSGTSWGKEPLKDYKTDREYNYDLTAVWGRSATAVYVGTQYGEILIFDGTGWSAMDPKPPIGSCTVNGIWAVNSTNVFVIDGCSNDVSRYNGTEWPYEDTGNTGNLHEIWGTALDNIYIVGTNGFIIRYNGTAWLAASSGTSKTLHSIHGSSATNVFAVGLQGAIVHNKGAGFVDESFNTVNDLFGVWAAPDGSAAYAVGTDGMILKYTPDPVATTTTTTPGGSTTTVPGGTTTTTPGGTSTTTSVPGGTTTTIPGSVTTSIVPPGEVGADFIGSPLTGKAPLQVQFTNLSGGDIATYQWVFGDGGVSTEKNPSHVYEKAGTYSVILTVIGTNGKTETKTRDNYISVKRSCALAGSLANPGELDLLRSLRDNQLETAAGLLLTSLYYRNTAEINRILDEYPEMRVQLRELVGDNIDIFGGLLRGEQVVLSAAVLADAVDFLDGLSARGSMALQRDVDLILTGIHNGYFLGALGITLE